MADPSGTGESATASALQPNVENATHPGVDIPSTTEAGVDSLDEQAMAGGVNKASNKGVTDGGPGIGRRAEYIETFKMFMKSQGLVLKRKHIDDLVKAFTPRALLDENKALRDENARLATENSDLKAKNEDKQTRLNKAIEILQYHGHWDEKTLESLDQAKSLAEFFYSYFIYRHQQIAIQIGDLYAANERLETQITKVETEKRVISSDFRPRFMKYMINLCIAGADVLPDKLKELIEKKSYLEARLVKAEARKAMAMTDLLASLEIGAKYREVNVFEAAHSEED